MNYCVIFFAVISMFSCGVSKSVVNINLKKDQTGWCFILLDSKLVYKPDISVTLNQEYNATCVSNLYFESKDIFRVYNSQGELINDNLKFTSRSSIRNGISLYQFYVPTVKELEYSDSYWRVGSSDRALLIDEGIKRKNELDYENICN